MTGIIVDPCHIMIIATGLKHVRTHRESVDEEVLYCRLMFLYKYQYSMLSIPIFLEARKL